eukprot:TRINITY_DN16829_c0_g1_i1.p1 TRINITY_DN16829_c0_g1~~TRINITY_DN16829_c0_g1_i1.p1  ORF type:complete len:260 (-),score=48.35 TRINITY_DN16829_c0_g1_i1:95-874(-)
MFRRIVFLLAVPVALFRSGTALHSHADENTLAGKRAIPNVEAIFGRDFSQGVVDRSHAKKDIPANKTLIEQENSINSKREREKLKVKKLLGLEKKLAPTKPPAKKKSNKLKDRLPKSPAGRRLLLTPLLAVRNFMRHDAQVKVMIKALEETDSKTKKLAKRLKEIKEEQAKLVKLVTKAKKAAVTMEFPMRAYKETLAAKLQVEVDVLESKKVNAQKDRDLLKTKFDSIYDALETSAYRPDPNAPGCKSPCEQGGDAAK